MQQRVHGKTVEIRQKQDSQANIQTRKKIEESDVLTHDDNPLENVTCKIGDNACAAKHVTVIQRTGLFHPRNESQKVQSLLRLQQQYGNRFVQQVIAQHVLQARLKINEPGDIYEQEAHQVVDAVMHRSEPYTPGGTEKKFQRQPIEEEEEELQAKELPRQTSEVTPNLESRINAIRGGGQPLPESVRAFFEPRFGYDFSHVRVHTDAKAAESAQAVNARAYTVGREVVFGRGQYAPETSSGQHLLAHELAHTLQQAGGLQGMLVQRMASCPPMLDASEPVPSGWKEYHGNSCWFHCCYRGILEDRRPSPDDPQNECFYDDNGALVDENHEDAGCRGTPNQYDSASDWWRHTFEDEGGIWARGWGAFWSSRWRDLNQHFEREGRRMMECHEICNQQPWYLRGFCLQGCSPTPY